MELSQNKDSTTWLNMAQLKNTITRNVNGQELTLLLKTFFLFCKSTEYFSQTQSETKTDDDKDSREVGKAVAIPGK